MHQRHFFMIALLGLGLTGCAGTFTAQRSPADAWVGVIYEGGSLPGAAEYRSGSVIDTTFTYAVTEASLANERFLLLDSLVAHTDDGRAVWKILDAFRLPALEESESLIDVGCNEVGAEPESIFAIVRHEGMVFTDIEIFHDIRAAWRASIEAGRFVELDPGNVECVNVMYGYDG